MAGGDCTPEDGDVWVVRDDGGGPVPAPGSDVVRHQLPASGVGAEPGRGVRSGR